MKGKLGIFCLLVFSCCRKLTISHEEENRILVDQEGAVIRFIFGSDPNQALLWLDYAITEDRRTDNCAAPAI